MQASAYILGDPVVTGFGPFDQYAFNASGNIAHRLHGRLLYDGRRIRGYQLPVSWERAPTSLTAIRELRQAPLLLMLGIAPADVVRLETQAVNQADSIADIDGASPVTGSCLIAGAPDTVRTKSNLRPLLRGLRSQSLFPVCLSRDAGRYLCNAIYFLAAFQRLAPEVVFLHVPIMNKANDDHALQTLTDAIQRALENCLTAGYVDSVHEQNRPKSHRVSRLNT